MRKFDFMMASHKISLFYFLLVVNHVFHIFEIYKQGYSQHKNMLISSFTLFLLLEIVLLLLLIYIGVRLVQKQKWAFSFIRVIAIVAVVYGLLLAFGNIYREEKIVGSFTGFFHVMIALPLTLWISDHLKKARDSSNS